MVSRNIGGQVPWADDSCSRPYAYRQATQDTGSPAHMPYPGRRQTAKQEGKNRKGQMPTVVHDLEMDRQLYAVYRRFCEFGSRVPTDWMDSFHFAKLAK